MVFKKMCCLMFLLSCFVNAQANPEANAKIKQFDASPVWPLCGRISEAPPQNWTAEQGCPVERFGNNAHTDSPLSSTYGPRQLVSEGYRYDFHRGLDIATPTGTPVFAIASGTVRKAGVSSTYSDPLIQVRHFRPGHNKCSTGKGCYVSNYMHLSTWVVNPGQKVVKGQLIGYTGASASGFEHLHFEVRDAPSSDVYSAWQRDAIHPLKVLPYPDESMNNFILDFENITVTDSGFTQVTVSLVAPITVELDLQRVEIDLYRRLPNNVLQLIAQSGDSESGDSGNNGGYHVYPGFYDMETFNRQYSHKNSSKQPWQDFANDERFSCPFADVHSSYSANVHLDHASNADFQIGQINGIKIDIEHYNANSDEYHLQLSFEQLIGTNEIDTLCVQATAVDVLGNRSATIMSNCD